MFGYASDAAYANKPYARSMDTKYYGFQSISGVGLCYSTKELESGQSPNAASTHLVQYHYVSNDGTTYYYYIQYSFTQFTYVKGSTCVTEGTLITMADGAQKPIEEVQHGDMVMTWNFFKGCYEAQPAVLVWNHGNEDHDVLNLFFSDGTKTRILYEHAFYDADINNFVYFRTDSDMAKNYIGDHFIKRDGNGNNIEVTLVDYEFTEEDVYAYTLMTANNLNFIAENMLSANTELEHPGMFDFFTINDDLKYDEALMQADIEKYGLYTYDDFRDVCTEQQFELLNFKYFKVTVGRGAITLDELKEIIRTYIH